MCQPELPSLAAALRALLDAYPTEVYGEGAEPLTLMVASGSERHTGHLQPGQDAWLTTLVQNEAAHRWPVQRLRPDVPAAVIC
ncbi:hypothetical protein [Streptomyces bobili]